MTAPAAHPVEGLPLAPTVDELIRAAAGFTDLGYLGPGGLLDLPLAGGRVLGLRIELPAGQVLALQSIGIDAEGVPVFPPIPADLLGVPCWIPAKPETYLESLYGAGWRVPDPFFRHDWNSSAYADITGG